MRIFSHDESQVRYGVVNFTSSAAVWTSFKAAMGFRDADNQPSQDDTYKIEHWGRGYGVIRKRDGLLMGGQTFPDPEAARFFIDQQSPRKVAWWSIGPTGFPPFMPKARA